MLSLGQPGAQSPRPAPAPPSAGASRPPGRALACVVPEPAGLQGTVPHGRGKRESRFLIPPGGAFSGMPGLSGRGHRPCHDAALGSGPAGGHSPRPAPDPPMAGASRPPGRALASVLPGPSGLQGTVPRGRGKRGSRFLIPPGGAVLCIPGCPVSLSGAIALAPALRCPVASRGPQPPASARPAPRGRWPLSLPVPPVQSAPARPDPPDQARGRVFATA